MAGPTDDVDDDEPDELWRDLRWTASLLAAVAALVLLVGFVIPALGL